MPCTWFGGHMKRREFIAVLGGVAAMPLAARAQQAAMALVGILVSASPTPFLSPALILALKESGYTEGQNVRIEQRWADGDFQLLPKLADELVSLPVNVLATFGTPASRVAIAASARVSPAVPVVFAMGSDPVVDGLVASLARPGGNATGITSLSGALVAKRIELMREFIRDDVLAIVINPYNPLSQAEQLEAENAARALGQRFEVL